MLHNDVKNMIEKNDIMSLKYHFCDSLDGDPTFKSYEDDYNYCVSNRILFESHREITPMSLSNITEEYWVQLKNDFLDNPSVERMDHMKNVAKILYKDRIEAIEAKNRKNADASYAKIKPATAVKSTDTTIESSRTTSESAGDVSNSESYSTGSTNSSSDYSRNISSSSSSTDGVRRVSERSQYQDNPRPSGTGASPKKASGMGLKLLILAIIVVVIIIAAKSCHQ